MWANSWLEPEYSRLAEIRVNVRDVVAQAKRELGGGALGTADAGESDGATTDPVAASLPEPPPTESGP
jgi:hypothetical protein